MSNAPRIKFKPTETEIREACERIRAGWSPRELRSRFMIQDTPWSVPTFTLTPGADNTHLSDSRS